MPYKAFNQELAKLYNCVNGLPENAGKYNWICPICFEVLYLIKYTIKSKINYYFLHENDVKAFIDKFESYSYVIWTSDKQIITNDIIETRST
ncbi:MAG: hypothetical protein ACFE8C_02190 [Promethearchaeota archaeon]